MDTEKGRGGGRKKAIQYDGSLHGLFIVSKTLLKGRFWGEMEGREKGKKSERKKGGEPKITTLLNDAYLSYSFIREGARFTKRWERKRRQKKGRGEGKRRGN